MEKELNKKRNKKTRDLIFTEIIFYQKELYQKLRRL